MDRARFGRTLRRAIVLPLAVTGALAALFGWQVLQLLSLAGWVHGTDRAITQAYRAERLLVDMETGLRGYLLTRDPAFMEPYTRAQRALPVAFDELRRLVDESALQLGRLTRLRAGQERWLAFAGRALELARSGGDVRDYIAAGHGKRIMDEMRREIARFVETQERLRDGRSQEVRRATWQLAGLGLGLAILFGGGLALAGRGALVDLFRTYDRSLAAERERREALAESEVRFRTLADTAPVLIWMIGPDGQAEFFNRGWLDFAGQPLEDALARGWEAGVHPDDLGRCRERLGEALSARGGFDLEYRRRRADGADRWVLDSGVPRFRPDGTFEGHIGSCLDITERRSVEQALREREQLFKTFMNNSPAVAFMKDGEGRLVYMNAGMERVFGVRFEDLRGRTDFDWLPPDTARQLRSNDRLVLASGETHELLETIPAPDGELHRWLVLKFPLLDAGGRRLLGGVGIDVTDRWRAEEEIRRLNLELEHKVGERTAQLEAANRELEAFSYSVSHDLRAPLRSIKGFSQVLLEDWGDRLDAGGRDSLERVCRAADRMAGLIDDLLALSRVTRDEMRIEPVDLSELGRTVAGELQRADPDRRVEIVIEEGLAARGDPRLLRIALENLLGNAWKFTGQREQARIELASAGRENGRRAFLVRDNGAGFDMAYAEKLFAPFQRLHAAQEFAGTGIGLATVQRIVARHGGRVWAEGRTGEGATFTFTL